MQNEISLKYFNTKNLYLNHLNLIRKNIDNFFLTLFYDTRSKSFFRIVNMRFSRIVRGWLACECLQIFGSIFLAIIVRLAKTKTFSIFSNVDSPIKSKLCIYSINEITI